ncbi:MAG TPA: hypothetical protein VE571_14295 [Solirubrobacteraceae bacterium]|nr:hypothetical protein [Solirubrobacteraceae bacterium]
MAQALAPDGRAALCVVAGAVDADGTAYVEAEDDATVGAAAGGASMAAW